ncbi:hypothetical protein [Bacillus sp. AK031]
MEHLDTKNQKTNIIINEIQFWKQNKMLPEHYCDYLLALYNQGEETDEKPAKNRKFSFGAITLSLLFLFLIPVSLFVIYFTELSFVLQTAILTGFVVLLIFAGIYYSRKEIVFPVIYISAAFIILIYSVNTADAYFQGSPIAIYMILFVNCILWIAAGILKRLLYFTVAGGAGLVILFISMVI